VSEIARHKTAIRRFALSRPLSLALSNGLISASNTVFDFGCGHGADIRFLRNAGYWAAGWDPHFRPGEALTPADCVNLGYVLNVIEDPIERVQTLQKAFDLARRVLVVAVRVDQALNDAAEFSDGLLTKVGSFQKLYKQDEFREFLQTALGRRPHMASLGIAYVFKDESAESEYLANLSIYRPTSFRDKLIADFSKDRLAQRYLSATVKLGRFPVASEFRSLPKMIERFGSLQRIERIAAGLLDPNALAVARERRRETILVYFGMMRLQGLNPPPIRALSDEVQADIAMLWPSYGTAIQAGTDFLFQLGKPGMINQRCNESPIGKKLPEDFYIHKSVEAQLPALLILMIFAARQVVGQIDYDVIKISLDGKKVSFLRYRDFEDTAHPELMTSVRVFLPTSIFSIRDYSNSLNPPILHRKESLLDPLHLRYAEFAALSAQEEGFNLLSRFDIGTRNGWQAVLKLNGLKIIGHSLVQDSLEDAQASSEQN
jgi:DNA phosphorothioation-associated putative methyltransferase